MENDIYHLLCNNISNTFLDMSCKQKLYILKYTHTIPQQNIEEYYNLFEAMLYLKNSFDISINMLKKNIENNKKLYSILINTKNLPFPLIMKIVSFLFI